MASDPHSASVQTFQYNSSRHADVAKANRLGSLSLTQMAYLETLQCIFTDIGGKGKYTRKICAILCVCF